MKYELHPACSAWPPMTPKELRDLADDISAYGLRDPVTLTPDGLLLDGRNRAIACEMADVEPATTIFDGDPWLFSLSRNKHRRHMTTDQIALIAAELATRTVGNPNIAIASNEAIGNAEAAKAAGVPETAIDLGEGRASARDARGDGGRQVRQGQAQEDGRRCSRTQESQRGAGPPQPASCDATWQQNAGLQPRPDRRRDAQVDHEVRWPKGRVAHLGQDVVDYPGGEKCDQSRARTPGRRSQHAHGRQGLEAGGGDAVGSVSEDCLDGVRLDAVGTHDRLN